ncbi:PAS domain S-box protein [Halomicroarcula sp. F13]|uniref:histidine kinase n=1 Tax=Haloarcula rubra TaxID=2487747 RepID=A0AAW4PMZ5_9EURY|nr:PAS domain S-box protein [Halomicroarcula rubra]MBX0322525.1 PAS domain S-box protein [Halomicroarcula rubra]
MTIPRETTVLLVSAPSQAEVGQRLRASSAATVRDVDSVTAAERHLHDGIDCVVSGVDLPDGSGLDLLERHSGGACDDPFVLVAFDGDETVAAEAVAAGVDRYVPADDPESAAGDVADAVSAVVETGDGSASMDHHEKLVQYSSDIIATYDRAGHLSHVNDSVTDTLGYDPADVVGEDPIEKVHPDDRDRIADFFDALRGSAGETRRVTYRFRTADGDYRTLESIGRNRLDDPELEAIVINSRDVTDREERKAELELYERIVETVPVGVHVLDETGTFLWVNDVFATTMGTTPEEIEGTDYTRVIEQGYVPEWISDAYDDVVRRLLSSRTDAETATIDAVPVQTAEGEKRLFDTHLGLLPLDDGAFAGTVTVFRDVTERTAYREELERQNERLEEFASVVTHDIRNPLSIAAAHVELAREDGESTHLDAAHHAIERAEELAENVLTLAREGKIVGETVAVDVAVVARAAWQTTETGTAALEVEPGVGTLLADETRLRQVFENLFRNAVEHGSTDSGSQADEDGGEHGATDSPTQPDDSAPSVTVTVGPLSDEAGFYVADDGPGIPEHQRHRLFETATGDDAGFGVAIVKTIADAHGWTVAVGESDAGGARFEVSDVTTPDAESSAVE